MVDPVPVAGAVVTIGVPVVVPSSPVVEPRLARIRRRSCSSVRLAELLVGVAGHALDVLADLLAALRGERVGVA